MKRTLAFSLLAALVAEPALAQGRRGGGEGGRSGSSSGGRGSMVRPPSFGGGGGARPPSGASGPSFRQGTPSIRPNIPSMAPTRPSMTPATPSFRSPTIERPTFSRPPIQTPNSGSRIDPRVSPPIQTPNAGSRIGETIRRPYVLPDRPGGGLADRPSIVRPDRPIFEKPSTTQPSLDLNRGVGVDRRPNVDFNRGVNVDGNRLGRRAPWDGDNRGDWNRGRDGDWNRGRDGDWNRGRDGDWRWGRHGDWRNGQWHDRHHRHHRHWHRGWWSWNNRPWFWGAVGGWWSASNVVYYNPYYVNTTLLPAPIDYSLPLPMPDMTTVTVEAGVETPLEPAAATATALLDEGRTAFSLRDYATALDRVDEAIRNLPSDPALHEFRALTLFAMGRYADAAAAIYAVLGVGPGSTWDTVSAFYLDPNEYTNQLRALESHVGANPNDPAPRFLLAYHYLVIGSQSAAADQLRVVTQLSPTDAVSAELLRTLTAPTET
jgi:hypothetical protein